MSNKKSKKLRLAFMGTPMFSVPILEALVSAGHKVVCVCSQPARPIGRGQKEKETPVCIRAKELGITTYTPTSLSGKSEKNLLQELKLDCIVVAAYGLILPKSILDSPVFGCLNVHASLLPRWRGAAPIQRAILAGDNESGVTIMQMDEGLDTGPVLMSDKISITSKTTGKSLHDALSLMGANLIIKALDDIGSGKVKKVAQPIKGVTYADKIERSKARIDWSDSSTNIERLVRAFFPWPGCWFEFKGERIKILSAITVSGKAPPGTILDDIFTVACGSGGLRLKKVQRAGKKPMSAKDFLRGFDLPIGTRLD